MPHIAFTRKPRTLDDVLAGHEPDAAVPAPAEIVETVSLTADAYDGFAAALGEDRNWLAGKGGWKPDGTRLAVAVTAPGRRTLYVDPSGFSYARYVGVEPGSPA